MTPVILSIHTAKTGGHTLREILRQIFGYERVLVDHPDVGARNPEDFVGRINNGHFDVIHGHEALLHKWEKHVPVRPVAWMRHPYTRLLSWYYYMRRSSTIKGGTNPPDTLDNKIHHIRTMPNEITRIWIPLDRFDDFEFIGLVEE